MLEYKPLKNKVLIVVDIYASRKHLTRMLDHWNIEYDVALNGNQVIYLASIKQYAVILMDFQLPEVNGYQVTKWIKTKSRCNLDTPIVAISLTVDDLEFDESKREDFYVILPTPCPAEFLFDLLCQLKFEIPIAY